jgi:hypothetical protein
MVQVCYPKQEKVLDTNREEISRRATVQEESLFMVNDLKVSSKNTH